MSEVTTSNVNIALEVSLIDVCEPRWLKRDGPVRSGELALLSDIGVEVTHNECHAVPAALNCTRDAPKHTMCIARPKIGVQMKIDNLKDPLTCCCNQLQHTTWDQRSHHDVHDLVPLEELLADGHGDTPR